MYKRFKSLVAYIRYNKRVSSQLRLIRRFEKSDIALVLANGLKGVRK